MRRASLPDEIARFSPFIPGGGNLFGAVPRADGQREEWARVGSQRVAATQSGRLNRSDENPTSSGATVRMTILLVVARFNGFNPTFPNLDRRYPD